jgi:hypothetical protein
VEESGIGRFCRTDKTLRYYLQFSAFGAAARIAAVPFFAFFHTILSGEIKNTF